MNIYCNKLCASVSGPDGWDFILFSNWAVFWAFWAVFCFLSILLCAALSSFAPTDCLHKSGNKLEQVEVFAQISKCICLTSPMCLFQFINQFTNKTKFQNLSVQIAKCFHKSGKKWSQVVAENCNHASHELHQHPSSCQEQADSGRMVPSYAWKSWRIQMLAKTLKYSTDWKSLIGPALAQKEGLCVQPLYVKKSSLKLKTKETHCIIGWYAFEYDLVEWLKTT